MDFTNDLEVFDYVSQHLLKQGKRAVNAFNECRYRIGNDSCAVGCLLSDDEYDEKMEGDNIIQIIKKFPHLRLAKANINLLERLQEIHDFEVIEHWPEVLEGIRKHIVRHDGKYMALFS